jgi:hypothetical protein
LNSGTLYFVFKKNLTALPIPGNRLTFWDGNLVIIENKLDDSGRDVTRQALKYASYCSSLSKEEMRVIFQYSQL